jgi:TetR/AcrR family transcriptional repressor of nem operon
MAKENTKLKLLTAGAKLVHENGFNNTGVQEILKAAGVPKGSFYFYFSNKEEFGLDLLDFFMDFIGERLDKHLKDPSEASLESLRAFFREMGEVFKLKGYKCGCPIGNLTQEMADLSEAFRLKLDRYMNDMKSGIASCLTAAQAKGELDASLGPEELADFILNSWEGAVLRMKAARSAEPLELFERMLFTHVLKR